MIPALIIRISLMIFLNIMSVALILYFYKIFFWCFAFTKPTKLPKTDKKHKFAILIPARNESNVIDGILHCIKNQNYDENYMQTFVIVKDKADKTIGICKNYGIDALVCENQTCKGDSLDCAIKHIYSNNLVFDAFVIFDADNLITPDFFTEFNKSFAMGYDIGLGYRNSKNWNDGWVASCSGLIFSMVNTMQNKARSKLNMNCVFSGTGYYIRESVLREHKCWPFKTLTEDYEISMYATLNNLKTVYVDSAEYFDEQPTNLKSSCKQRARWFKGFMQVNSLYLKRVLASIFTFKRVCSKIDLALGITPVILGIIASVLFGISMLVSLIWSLIIGASAIAVLSISLLLWLFVSIYLILAFYCVLMLVAETKRTNLSTKNATICIFLYPFFSALYVPIAIKALFTKDLKWDAIVHSQKCQ